jgi:hypothetical protein
MDETPPKTEQPARTTNDAVVSSIKTVIKKREWWSLLLC